MNLRSVDLNLLVILDALLDERHVSRAAQRLCLSQPATSSALERCRALFGDRLLERAGGGMRITAKGESLRGPLKAALAAAASVFGDEPPDLMRIRQTVRITMADLAASLLVGSLFARVRHDAPGLCLAVLPWHGAAAAAEALARGDADLAVSVFDTDDPAIRRRIVSRERYAVVMRRGHPAAAAFDLDAWLAHPHLLVSGRAVAGGTLDEALAAIGRSRRIGLVLPSFLVALSVVESSDLIAMLPVRCVDDANRSRFAVFEPPVAVDGFPLHLAWHGRRDGDVAVQHVAAIIAELLSGGSAAGRS